MSAPASVTRRANGSPKSVAGRPPPQDLQAEAAVLSAVMLTGTIEAVPQLRPAHFFSDANGRVFEACLALAIDRRPIDLVTVASWLRDREVLTQIGGADYLAQLSDTTPAVANVAAHAVTVMLKARMRRVIETARRIAAEGYGDVREAEAWLQAAARDIAAVADADASRRLAKLATGDIFAEVAPTAWVVEALQLGPGRPNLLVAPAGRGKTIFSQSIALAVAAGVRLWGQFGVRRGRVLHIDHDQGGAATRKRYQRLAAGHGITVDDLDGRLEAIIRPPFYLNALGSEAAYLRLCEGVDFCIIDALRGATPGVDENDSRIRDGMDMLARVSEQTGTAFQLLHHAGRAAPGETEPRTRGSSAIDDASGSHLVLSGERGKPRLVRIARDSQEFDGRQVTEPFYLEIVDVPIEGQPPAMRVEYRTAEQVNPPRLADAAFNDKVRRVADAIASNPGIAGAEVLAERLKIRPASVRAALQELGERVRNDGTKARPRLHLVVPT